MVEIPDMKNDMKNEVKKGFFKNFRTRFGNKKKNAQAGANSMVLDKIENSLIDSSNLNDSKNTSR